jgi:hypothetical protein
VQGVNELITDSHYGTILDMTNITPKILADNIELMTQSPYDKMVIEKHGAGFSWEQSAKAYGDIIISPNS